MDQSTAIKIDDYSVEKPSPILRRLEPLCLVGLHLPQSVFHQGCAPEALSGTPIRGIACSFCEEQRSLARRDFLLQLASFGKWH